MNQNQNFERVSHNNAAYQNEGVMRLRIDTRSILDDIESFLRGGIFVSVKEDGKVKEIFEARGVPKMNPAGVQSMMSLLSPWFSPHTVQGNYNHEQYEDFILELDLILSEVLMVNINNWEVDIKDYNQICNMIIMTAQPFFSRLINDGERNSYASTVSVSESNTLQQQNAFKFPNLGRN